MGSRGDQREFIFLVSFPFIEKKNLTIMALALFLIGKIVELCTESEKCWDAGHRWL